MDNKCFLAFGFRPSDKLLVVKEHGYADSNFVFSYLISQALQGNDSQVLVILTHDTQPHFECAAIKIGCNLTQKIQEGRVKIIDFRELVAKSFETGSQDVLEKVGALVRAGLEPVVGTKKYFVFIDDYSHVNEIVPDVGASLNFLNSLLGQSYNAPNFMYIIGVHIGDQMGMMVSNDLEHSADCIIDVSLMKTGRSDDISGIMKVVRNRKLLTYHYIIKEYGVDILAPGTFLLS